jgi:hypothetical protein
MSDAPKTSKAALAAAALTAGGWLELDLGVLQLRRLEHISKNAIELTRAILLDYMRTHDSDKRHLRDAAREIVLDVPEGMEIGSDANAVLAEAKATLLGEAIDADVLSRFTEESERMVWCEPGWYSIILGLDKRLATEHPQIRYTQIKEKLGGLRLHVSVHSPKINELIRAAEDEASRTCERCGLAGILREDQARIQTLCDYHADNRL